MSRDSVVPLGLLVGGMLLAATSSWTVAVALTEHSSKMDRLESMVESLTEKIDRAAEDSWRRHDMLQWVDLLIAKNPSLVVPPVR